MRLVVFYLFIFLGMGGAPSVFAENAETIPVQWYEPKAQATARPGLTQVSLLGQTEANALVETKAENIIVIQRADAKNNENPVVTESRVRSDAKGYFRLRLFVPNGLSQVPILFQNTRGQKNTVLLTMRVDAQDINLNVKVLRPVKTKIIKVVETVRVQYGFGLDWSPLMLQETFSLNGQSSLNLQQTVFTALRMESMVKYPKWWWLGSYEYASAKAPSNLDGRTVLGGDFNLQTFLIDGRYRLTDSKSNEFWMGLSVDQRFLPILTLSALDQVHLVSSKIFRVGLDLTSLWHVDPMDYLISVYYHEPVAIKVDAGELTYTSRYSAGLEAQVNYHTQGLWTFGTTVGFETSSFGYEYNNSPLSIANKGSGTQTIFQILGKVEYSFEDKKKEQ